MAAQLSYQLSPQLITSTLFKPFGQVIFATPDGKPYNTEDAKLELSQGIPRFYIMRLPNRGHKVHQITRHLHCTQCLGSLESKEWLLVVAPPGQANKPTLEAIVAFRIPGTCFVKLEVGTWHAGPYFEADWVNFYNLELSDTNITDHDTCNLLEQYGLEFEIVLQH
jgi:ureidoglycolate hydrolase